MFYLGEIDSGRDSASTMLERARLNLLFVREDGCDCDNIHFGLEEPSL